MCVHHSALTGPKFDDYNLNFASVWAKSHPVHLTWLINSSAGHIIILITVSHWQLTSTHEKVYQKLTIICLNIKCTSLTRPKHENQQSMREMPM
jgi:hypothetical protein